MPEMPAGYYDRSDPAKNYDEHLFRAGFVLQSSELNEIQKASSSRLKGVADALFKDGDIIRDCVCTVDDSTGDVACSDGAVYLRGAVRGVPSSTFTIAVTGTVVIGIYLVDTVVDENVDTSLKDPAVGMRNYQQAGAARLKVEPVWGYDGDGNTGDFFPMYVADNAVLRPKAPPPTVDAVARAIARYDKDSTGGSYVISGMMVKALADSGSDQVYSVSDGSARVNGSGVEFSTSRRISFDPDIDLLFVDSEPHLSSGTSSQRVDVSFTPIANVTSIHITKERTVTLTHGAYSGASDALPDTSVLQIMSVSQGATTYVETSDYLLTSNSVDWSPGGAEPSTGSSYNVTYRYIASVSPDSVDDTGLYVTGAVTGTLILVSYNQKMPRFDRICMSDSGLLVWIKGVASNNNPLPPQIPSTMLGLCTIQQNWMGSRVVTNDSVRVVPMNDIAKLSSRIDYVLGLVAQQRLESNIHTRTTGIIKSIFTDPFIDDTLRNAGVSQNGAVFGGVLTLPIDLNGDYCDSRGAGAISSLPFTGGMLIEQTARTGSMKVNPYNAFSGEAVPLVPASVVLDPSIDRWTVIDDVSASTRLMLNWWGRADLAGADSQIRWGVGSQAVVWSNVSGALISVGSRFSSVVSPLEFIRVRSVDFTITGFIPGETLANMTFDGVAVTATGTSPANGSGVITGSFTIPANIPSGSKSVVFNGSGGSYADATYIGVAATIIDVLSIISTTMSRRVDPLAETFTPDSSRQWTSVDLWFTDVGTSPIEVQIRETSNGVPNATVLTRVRKPASSILTDGNPTNFGFDHPLFLTGGQEYAIVVLSDDAVAAVAIAELGKKDTNTNQYVTAQPYQVGVLLSSSNASTWSAHQDRDLTFKLNAASFTSDTTTISLGSVAVTGATDLAVRANIESPSAITDCKFVLTLPDSSTVTVMPDQSISLNAPITGSVAIDAVLTGDSENSPILFSDVQLLWGVVDTSATYFSRYITGGSGVVAKVIVEALLPGTSSIEVAVKGDADPTWTVLSSPSSVIMYDDWVELTYTSGSLTETTVATRLTLSGTTQYRPGARNLRMLVQ